MGLIDTVVTAVSGAGLTLLGVFIQRRIDLTDRRNERRHEAVLEALRSVTSLRATFRCVPGEYGMRSARVRNGEQEISFSEQIGAVQTALGSLRVRVNDKYHLCQLSTFIETLVGKEAVDTRDATEKSLDDLRTFLLELLD